MDQKLLTDFRSELLDSRFGAKAISTIAESKRFPLHEMRDDVAFQIINDELYLDGNARQNLATFCQKTGSTKKNIRNPQPSTCVA